MNSLPKLLVAAPLGLLLAAAPVAADTIYRISDPPIEDCRIVEETLTSVIYKPSRGKDVGIRADSVLEIVYSRMPKGVDEAETALRDGDIVGAFELFDAYLDEQTEGRAERRYKWAPAYAAKRVIELRLTMGDMSGAARAANRLIESFPDSRYLPGAYLSKANAEYWAQKDAKAQQTLRAFETLITEQNLSRRWDLECRLGLLLTDKNIKGEERRKLLGAVEAEARGDFPTVRNRALVSIAESLLESKNVAEAETMFREIVADPKADPETLAGAYTGLADSLYERGVTKGDKQAIHEALKSYMRVVVNHMDQTRYSSKAMFFAGRCFDYEEDRPNARKMYRAVIRELGRAGREPEVAQQLIWGGVCRRTDQLCGACAGRHSRPAPQLRTSEPFAERAAPSALRAPYSPADPAPMG